MAYRAQKLKRVDEFAGIVQKRNGKKITRHDIRQDYTSLFIDPISLGRITSVLSFFFFLFFFKRTAGGTRILFYVHSVIYDCIFLNFFFFFFNETSRRYWNWKKSKDVHLGGNYAYSRFLFQLRWNMTILLRATLYFNKHSRNKVELKWNGRLKSLRCTALETISNVDLLMKSEFPVFSAEVIFARSWQIPLGI